MRRISALPMLMSLLALALSVGCGTGVGSESDNKVGSQYNTSGPTAGIGMNGDSRHTQPPSENTEDYTNYGVNPWTETSDDNLSTFAIDVDTGSYTIARRKIREGTRPPKDSVRVEEFLNYFDYKYNGPEDADAPFKLHVDGSRSPFDTTHHFIRVAIQGKRLQADQRKPVHLTFLVDVSGSMRSADKLELAKRSLRVLVSELRDGDTVALTTYAGAVKLVLSHTGMDEREKIEDAIEALVSGGSTAMNDGLKLAYKTATEEFVTGHVNRVIVLSDGDANVGKTSWEEMLDEIAGYVDEGITMSTIGFGMGNYKDTQMEQLANKGNGNYYYIDTLSEAKKVFAEQLNGTLQVIAKDVKIQVEFNNDVIKSYRLVGYENRDIADIDFRNDAVDAGELGAGHSVTAIYEVILQDAGFISELDLGTATVTVRLRYKQPDASTDDPAKELAFPLDLAGVDIPFDQAGWSFRWALAVTGFAEILRESEHASTWSLDQILSIAKESKQPQVNEHSELIELIEALKALP